MQLLSLHTTNIGPFYEQTVIVRPRRGSFLIKAPIGSGKSFLFFDGPVFALYKKSSRPMLNKRSKTGQIACEWIIDGMQYCVIRTLTKTKTGESVSSQLRYKNAQSPDTVDGPIIQTQSVTPFEIDNSYERLEVKNETDLQKILDDLLPRKEVFLATYFLLQDSANVFELPPRERLEIFKHVFDLLGIDESKDKIAESKREISALIKVRSDNGQYDEKFIRLLEELLTVRTDVSNQFTRYKVGDHPSLTMWHDFMSEQALLRDKVNIEHFRLPDPLELVGLQQSHTELSTRHTQLQTQLEGSQNNSRTLETSLQQLRREHLNHQNQLDRLQQQLSSYSDRAFQDITAQLTQAQKSQEDFLTTHRNERQTQKMMNQLSSLHAPEAQQWIAILQANPDLRQLRHVIQQIIALAKDYKQQILLREQKISSGQQFIVQLQSQITESERRLQEFGQTLSQQQTFFCDKIDGHCPYVEMINTATFKQLHTQQTALQSSHNQLLAQLTTRQLEQNALVADEYHTRLKQDLGVITAIVVDSDWKAKEQLIAQLTTLEQQTMTLQKQWSELQTQQSHHQSLKEQSLTVQTQIQTLTQQITSAEQTLHDTQTNQETLRNQLQTLPGLAQLQADSQILIRYEQIVDRLSRLLEEYKSNQLLLKQLKEKEKILTDLYLVFSKELLLIVVQRNLPQIQDLMNLYLGQVVEYQLTMEISPKSTSTESLELFVTVTDEYGAREVESLSGGQKVILKLVWMMAISTIMRSSMLYLDETINNLDGDTVAKVAELLKNFIKGKGEEFQFYVVTHSHQIQDIDLWDGVIEIGK